MEVLFQSLVSLLVRYEFQEYIGVISVHGEFFDYNSYGVYVFVEVVLRRGWEFK